jgi:hypothetical protein
MLRSNTSNMPSVRTKPSGVILKAFTSNSSLVPKCTFCAQHHNLHTISHIIAGLNQDHKVATLYAATAGRLLGPLPPLLSQLVQTSPIGLIPKPHQPGKWRLRDMHRSGRQPILSSSWGLVRSWPS